MHEGRAAEGDSVDRISCSVKLLTSQSGIWRARFRYAGAVETWGRSAKLWEGPDHQLTLSTNIRTNQPLPGGEWACEFAFRAARAVVAFRSGGPVGEIVNTAVCPEPGVLAWGQHSKTCATDLSGKPLRVGETVYCSAVFAGVGGKSAQIRSCTRTGRRFGSGTSTSNGRPSTRVGPSRRRSSQRATTSAASG